MHVAGDAAAAHLGHQLQGLAQLLVAAALADHGGVGVHVAQGGQLVPLRQGAQPVEQLRRPEPSASGRHPAHIYGRPLPPLVLHVSQALQLKRGLCREPLEHRPGCRAHLLDKPTLCSSLSRAARARESR